MKILDKTQFLCISNICSNWPHSAESSAPPYTASIPRTGGYTLSTQKILNPVIRFHLTDLKLYDIIILNIFFLKKFFTKKKSAAYATLFEKGWEDLLVRVPPAERRAAILHRQYAAKSSAYASYLESAHNYRHQSRTR